MFVVTKSGGAYLCEALKAATFAFFSATRFAKRELIHEDGE